MLEIMPAGAPNESKWHYYSFNGNLFSTKSADLISTVPMRDDSSSLNFFSCEGRDRVPDHALRSEGDGRILIQNLHFNLYKFSTNCNNRFAQML